ncbi:hypothetical protein GC088_06090 [Arthrobacter sp. JZ12]|uniref:PT domain-containing protein n=1 Tax=Arthrobacter sp. JZ12 TaxID=2654190 RepID=UPI002B459FEF|nr:PT domain-containing protein [Arthrobacter sp. JZ12]WRH24680.1 hypothetical protein GC088_06090 [Arthrobacter sp. JZ12]
MNTESIHSGPVSGLDPDENEQQAFSDDRGTVVPLQRRRRVAAIIAGAAAAAAVAGAVVVGGTLEAPNPLPAASTDPTPSAAPSEEATGAPSPTPEPTADPTAEPTGVPTGPPADEGCRVEDVDRVMEQGSDFMSLTPLTTNPSDYVVVGCTDEWMALEMTDEANEASQLDGGNAWFYIARRVDGQWLLDTNSYGTILKWDTYVHPEGFTPQELMDQRFAAAGIPVELREELVGEGPEMSDLRNLHQLTDLGLVFETPGDWEVLPASQGVDLVNAEGTKVANVQHSNASGLGGACVQDAVAWEEIGAVPVSVTGTGGVEIAARFTLRIFDGNPRLATPALVAAHEPTSGESCMLYNVISEPATGLLALATSFTLSPHEAGNALEFASRAEAEAYADSEEFAVLAEIAESLVVTN